MIHPPMADMRTLLPMVDRAKYLHMADRMLLLLTVDMTRLLLMADMMTLLRMADKMILPLMAEDPLDMKDADPASIRVTTKASLDAKTTRKVLDTVNHRMEDKSKSRLTDAMISEMRRKSMLELDTVVKILDRASVA